MKLGILAFPILVRQLKRQDLTRAPRPASPLILLTLAYFPATMRVRAVAVQYEKIGGTN